MDVLLLEDDGPTANVLKTWFEMISVRCIQAQTVEEAMECIKTHKPRNIIVDLLLGSDTMGDFMGCLALLPPDNLPRVVVFTTNPFTDEMAKRYEFVKILRKPFALEDLEKSLIF